MSERECVALNKADRYRYCYDDLDDDGDNDYLYSWPAIVKGGDIVRDVGPCSAGYFCAAPGRRHGHSSETVLIEGDATMLLVVGGESGHWVRWRQTTVPRHPSLFDFTPCNPEQPVATC